MIAWLQHHPALSVGTPTPVDVGGAPGIRVDITGADTPPCETPPNRIFLFDSAQGRLFVRPKETIRVIALDVGTSLVVLLPRASRTASTAGDDLRERLVQPLIDSMQFSPS